MEGFINSNYRSMIENNYEHFVEGIRGKMNERGIATLGDFLAPEFLAAFNPLYRRAMA